MHEIALLTSVVRAVERAADKADAKTVRAVGLKVGTMSGAVLFALEGGWPIVTAGTALEGATLDIEVVQAAIWCPTCDAEQPIDEFYALTCPVCGTPCGNLVKGREFEVTYADVGDQPAEDSAQMDGRPPT